MAAESTAGRVVRGVVEDGEGRAVAGARVRAEAGGEEATAGADGAFVLRVPGPAEPAADEAPLVLRVADRGRDTVVAVPADARDALRVVAVPPDAVAVRVLTPGTAPVPARFGWQALRHAETGLVGGPTGDATTPRFCARGLAPGTWTLVVWGGPFLPTVAETVVLDGRRSAGLVTVELARRGASVAGRVLTSAGAPRPGATVSLRPEDASLSLPPARGTSVADGGGRWRIEGVPPGRYTVVVDAGGPASEQAIHLLDREERAADLVV